LQRASRLLLFSDIHASTDVLRDVTGLVQDRMADRVKLLDGTVSKHDPVLSIEFALPPLRVLIGFSDPRPVVRMNTAVHPIDGRQRLRGADGSNAQDLRRHGESSGREMVLPTSGVAQSLRLQQIGLAPPQLLL